MIFHFFKAVDYREFPPFLMKIEIDKLADDFQFSFFFDMYITQSIFYKNYSMCV